MCNFKYKRSKTYEFKVIRSNIEIKVLKATSDSTKNGGTYFIKYEDRNNNISSHTWLSYHKLEKFNHLISNKIHHCDDNCTWKWEYLASNFPKRHYFRQNSAQSTGR